MEVVAVIGLGYVGLPLADGAGKVNAYGKAMNSLRQHPSSSTGPASIFLPTCELAFTS